MSDEGRKKETFLERLAALPPGHAPPVSRRDFLAHGLTAFAATTFAPSLFGTFEALADPGACQPVGAAGPSVPFLVFDCAGGAALPGNFLVGKDEGLETLLSGYDRLGWDPKPAGALDTSFGLPMAAQASRILQGIRATTSAGARAHFRMGSFCHFAQDDTVSNPLSAAALAAKAGLRGKILVRGLGTRNSPSGGNSQAAMGETSLKPVFVASINDLKGAVGLTGGAFAKFTPGETKAMLQGTQRLDQELAKALGGTERGKTLARLARCAHEENLKLVDTPAQIDPRTVPIFQQVYGLNSATQPNAQNSVFAALVMNVLAENTGPSVLTIAGCDYHTGNQAAGDAKDLEIGQHIGRAVEAAHRMKKPLFLQLLTDGGCANRQGTRDWVSDSGERCMTVIGFYHPETAPAMRRLQVGSYTDGQVANRETPIGASPFKVACAVFANYLRLTTKPENFQRELEAVLPRGTFQSMAEVESLLVFG